jgi:hypothetical protein
LSPQLFRLARKPSQRIGQIIGRLAVDDTGRLNAARAFLMGLAD